MSRVKKLSIIFSILTVFLFFANIEDGIYGNPISKYLATKQITNYLDNTLNLKKYKIQSINKNMKYGGDYLAVVNADEISTEFWITSTEKNVTWHTIRVAKQPINVDKINYSSQILIILFGASLVIFLVSTIILVYTRLIKFK